MSIWDQLFDTDWKQRNDIDALQRRARSLRMQLSASQHELRAELNELEKHVAGICLFNRTLLRVLTEKGVVSPNEFKAKFEELDLEDGQLNGR